MELIMAGTAVVTKAEPYTREELEPFSADPRIPHVIDNLFCVGAVRDREAEEGFIGWIVQGQRPLCLSRSFPGAVPEQGVLCYGNAGDIFPNYQAALDALFRTYDYALSQSWRHWFERPMRIFSVARRVHG